MSANDHLLKLEPEIITDAFLSDRQAEIWEVLCYTPHIHEVLIGGSAGGGKSSLLCMWQIWRRCVYANTRGFIGRYSFTDLEDTTLKTFLNMWNTYGRHNPMGVNMAYVGHTARFSNGSEILFRWLKPSSSAAGKKSNQNLGSLELTDAAIDEVTEVPQKTVEMLNSRIRYNLIDGEPKLGMSCNPALNWVKYTYIKTKKGHPITLKEYQEYCPLSLKHNPDEDFARQYARQLDKLQGAERARLRDGDWDAIEVESPWFHAFNYTEHTVGGSYQIDEFEPIYISFDFNIEPMTATVGQYTPDRGLCAFRSHEIKGLTEHMCDELLKYGYQDNLGGILITGDVSGKARHTASGLTKYGEISTDYSVIKEKFGLTDDQIVHTGKQNPRLKYSRRLVNHAFESGVLKIYRDGCPELIEDVRGAVANTDDTLLKTDENGLHHADNFRYLVHMVFKRGYKDVNEARELLNFTESPSPPPPPSPSVATIEPAEEIASKDEPEQLLGFDKQKLQNRLKRRRR